jgi:hypothetical protein
MPEYRGENSSRNENDADGAASALVFSFRFESPSEVVFDCGRFDSLASKFIPIPLLS